MVFEAALRNCKCSWLQVAPKLVLGGIGNCTDLGIFCKIRCFGRPTVEDVYEKLFYWL